MSNELEIRHARETCIDRIGEVFAVVRSIASRPLSLNEARQLQAAVQAYADARIRHSEMVTP